MIFFSIWEFSAFFESLHKSIIWSQCKQEALENQGQTAWVNNWMEVQETSPGENDSFKSQIKIKTFVHNAYNGPFINIHKFYLLWSRPNNLLSISKKNLPSKIKAWRCKFNSNIVQSIFFHMWSFRWIHYYPPKIFDLCIHIQ